MGVPMGVFLVVGVRRLMAVLWSVFVRPGVRVGVAHVAVTVQVALHELIGSGGHGLKVRWVSGGHAL
jgi:hypothetical protein